ncbi:hypothetical protein AOQ84DRAFT_386277 [Glonium stellatum]|uniref:DUF6594 domain-containing protein n=1 Tax=Glonium stellatum TaxID=574774 RepID=A0A8E2JWI3_9PEZI|nr:hypothetical protein AOQ84DRAFT_386277 [Glonium stellatum]
MANTTQSEKSPEVAVSDNAQPAIAIPFPPSYRTWEDYDAVVKKRMSDWPQYNNDTAVKTELSNRHQSSNDSTNKKRPTDWPQSSDDVVRIILQHNILNTRAILYKDYMTGLVFESTADGQSQIQLHVDQYLKAEQNYKTFNQIHGTNSIFIQSSINSPLTEAAAHIATVEAFEKLQDVDPHPVRKETIEKAHRDLNALYTKSFIQPINTSNQIRLVMDKYYSGPVGKAAGRAVYHAFLHRFIMAVSGGLALIVPMLIMTLHPTKLTALLTTSVFVIAIAGGFSWPEKNSEDLNIIVYTAAYAAVLVVFVGTANPAGGLSNSTIGAIVAGVVGSIVGLALVLITTPALKEELTKRLSRGRK